ncbi:MAG: EamA family transporter [Leptolyngbya foveolarum]|uniref:EamA family transporter n=1 Tax=Leptolyngbya foveolarum TaxID=47253 RepID=A0A2W4TYH2_9CYAN|nr:MAG: EamA family transporter [Leptolyngbya foveolarum]
MLPTLKRPSPIGLLLCSILFVQFGSALAKSLFGELGPWGVVSLRVSFSALFFFVVWRLKWNAKIRENIGSIIAFGLILAAMNSAFYAAIDRIPLGIAITLEFTGPLGLAVLKSQRWLDLFWAMLAIAGISLLAPINGFTIDLLGMGLALLAGVFWAIYILLAAKVGARLSGIEGLAWALVVSTIILLPIGIATTGSALLNPKLLALGAGVALLSTAIPYSFEMTALRSLPIKVFSIMLSLEPMAGVIAGLLILQEKLSVRAIAACLLVSIAAAGAARFNPTPPPPTP